MLEEKRKAAFRVKVIELPANRSKTVTLYQGKEKKNLDQVMAQLLNCLREKKEVVTHD